MENDRLMKLSRRLQRLLWLVGAVMTGAALLRWFASDDLRAWLPPTLAAYAPSGPHGIAIRIAGFCVESIPLAAALYTLVALNRICAAYVEGKIFSAQMASLYRAFGRGLLLLGAANGLYVTLVTAVFTFSPGSRISIVFGLSTADLYLLLTGGAVLMLGFVMQEAYRLQSENSQIV
jgi:Protein of unknown function (DUF2975)